MKNRKAFNFYRSYYDVVVELPDEQKVQFLMAILNKQFLDVEPRLDGLVGLLYKSQKHSIDAQVVGYKNKKGITTEGTTEPPTEVNKENIDFTYQPPTQPPTLPPSVQGEEQGEVKGKWEVKGQVYVKNLKEYKFITYNKVKGINEFETLTKEQRDALVPEELEQYNFELSIHEKQLMNEQTN